MEFYFSYFFWNDERLVYVSLFFLHAIIHQELNSVLFQVPRISGYLAKINVRPKYVGQKSWSSSNWAPKAPTGLAVPTDPWVSLTYSWPRTPCQPPSSSAPAPATPQQGWSVPQSTATSWPVLGPSPSPGRCLMPPQCLVSCSRQGVGTGPSCPALPWQPHGSSCSTDPHRALIFSLTNWKCTWLSWLSFEDCSCSFLLLAIFINLFFNSCNLKCFKREVVTTWSIIPRKIQMNWGTILHQKPMMLLSKISVKENSVIGRWSRITQSNMVGWQQGQELK